VLVLKIVIVYESMYGNTHLVAEKVAEGINSKAEAMLVPVAGADPELISSADLLVVGGPTHLHGLSSSMSRHAAQADASKVGHALDPDAESDGLRTWFHSLGPGNGRPSASFDTRLKGPATITGRASRGIGRRLRHLGYRMVVAPESFLVDKENNLVPGEGDRARAWAHSLADNLAAIAEA